VLRSRIIEIAAVTLLGVWLLEMNVLDALLLGSILGAVSPAVIIPKMIKMIEEHHGTDRGIPQLILAGASADDIVVILIFTILMGLSTTGTFSIDQVIQVPIGLGLGIGVGLIFGLGLVKFFKAVHMRDSIKVIILLSISFFIHCPRRSTQRNHWILRIDGSHCYEFGYWKTISNFIRTAFLKIHQAMDCCGDVVICIGGSSC
jgi:NhaP-type Na+/H+ or K+/H+ antiporter